MTPMSAMYSALVGMRPRREQIAASSAVLWRQMGGSLWDFVFSRRAMMQAIEAELG